MIFLHHLKYAMKTMLKNRTTITWTLLFPMLLGTFMYLSFGSLGKEELFDVISVGVVKETENLALEQMLEELSEEGNLLNAIYFSEKEAEEALKEGEIEGILYIKEELQLVIMQNSYESTILKSVLDEYKKQEVLLQQIGSIHPNLIEQVITDSMEEKTFLVEKIISDGNQDAYTNYFYAIFAMSCLFASFAAIEKIEQLQTENSSLGMRRSISPSSKISMIIAEFLSMLFVQFLIEAIALFYFSVIGIDFGHHYLPILGILFLGCCIGIAMGIIIASCSKLSENLKTGLCITISMVLSILGDLIGANVKNYIEHTIPILNKINPAALIVDSFCALNIYDTYDRYIQNMVTLGGMTILLLILSFVMLRRKQYARI